MELSGLMGQYKRNRDEKEGWKDGRKVIKKEKGGKKKRKPKKYYKICLKYSLKGKEAWTRFLYV